LSGVIGCEQLVQRRCHRHRPLTLAIAIAIIIISKRLYWPRWAMEEEKEEDE
jgi:hypothetical protein